MNNCGALTAAVERYIAKADENLSEELKNAGFIEPAETVKYISEAEDKTAVILEEQNKLYFEKLKNCKNISDIEKVFEEIAAEDLTAEKITALFTGEFKEIVPKLSNWYLKENEKDLVIREITRRTTNWIETWSPTLGALVGESLGKELKPIFINALLNDRDKTKGIQEIAAEIYDKRYHDSFCKSRRIAITEVLRAHSVSAQEAIIQNPTVELKEWGHTGSFRNKPRENHEFMNGVTAKKDEPFNLVGSDGLTYSPMYPRDYMLPASESVNCHCIHRAVIDDEAIGWTTDEKEQLQEQSVESDNAKFENEKLTN